MQLLKLGILVFFIFIISIIIGFSVGYFIGFIIIFFTGPIVIGPLSLQQLLGIIGAIIVILK